MINCDEAEEVGDRIIQKMNGLKFKDISLKRKDQVRTLAHVTNTVSASTKKPLHNIDPTVFFNRLLVIMQRSSDLKQYFAHELSAMPTSLFKDNYMRKADKSQLGKEICKVIPSSFRPQHPMHVIDGVYLLRVVQWCEGGSCGDIVQQYVSYIDRHYGLSSVIVFDG
jgi:hypothetical protein